MRKLALPVLAASALLAVSAPAANAISVSGVMKIVTAAIKPIQDVNAGQTAAINGVDKRVDTVVSNLAGVSGKVNAILAGVPQITDGLKALKDGLTAIQAALNNTTTGLVGLNLARPQFGIYSAAGAFLGGTGTAASGPKAAAIGTNGSTAYVIDFGNDVSKRVYSVNQFAGATGVPTATNCSVGGAAAATCGALQSTSADTSPNHVLVTFTSSPTNGWSVTAISG